jgi:phosphoserine phosphatase RsbU/P
MATSPRITPEVPFAPRSLQIDQVEDLLKLQKAAEKITSILDLDELIDKVVHEIAQSFGCDEANIYLHDDEHGELVLTGVCGCTIHNKGDRKKIGKEGMVGHAAAIGRMYYAPDVRTDPYYIRCEESTLSEVAIPLIVQGKLVGVFSTSHAELDAFPPDQLRLLQVLCSHIAVAIHNARLFQQERQAREKMTREAHEARSIQQALLPKSSPLIPGFALSGLSIPAGAVGGDWYDFIPLGENRWGLVLADVSGKGTAAALLMSATRAMLRSLAETVCTPSEVLTKLNRLLVDDFPLGRFVTLVYGVLDPSKRTLTFANAGHLRPLLVDHDGGRYLDTDRGLPLGIASGEYSETTVSLADGSRLVFYSDGLTEAENGAGEEYGTKRLLNHVSRPEACAECILEDVRRFTNGAGLQDDATVIFLRG